jgi:hypothetical protein
MMRKSPERLSMFSPGVRTGISLGVEFVFPQCICGGLSVGPLSVEHWCVPRMLYVEQFGAKILDCESSGFVGSGLGGVV